MVNLNIQVQWISTSESNWAEIKKLVKRDILLAWQEILLDYAYNTNLDHRIFSSNVVQPKVTKPKSVLNSANKTN